MLFSLTLRPVLILFILLILFLPEFLSHSNLQMKQAALCSPAHVNTPLIYFCYNFVVSMTLYIPNKIVGTGQLTGYCYGQIFCDFM